MAAKARRAGCRTAKEVSAAKHRSLRGYHPEPFTGTAIYNVAQRSRAGDIRQGWPPYLRGARLPVEREFLSRRPCFDFRRGFRHLRLNNQPNRRGNVALRNASIIQSMS